MDLSELLAALALVAALLVMGIMIVRGRVRADNALSPKVRRARQGYDLVAALPSALLAVLVTFGIICWLTEIEVSPRLLMPVFLAVAIVGGLALPAGLLWISVAVLAHLRRRYALDDGETRELVGALYPGRYRQRVERRLLGDRDRQEDGHEPT